MFRFDLPFEDLIVEECLTNVAFLVEEAGLDAALDRLTRADDRTEDTAGLGLSCNLIPSGNGAAACHRVLIALSRGRAGRRGSNAVLEQVSLHLVRCGTSVEGDPPHREATRYAVVFHDELDTRAWRERHRPMLEAFRARGVRLVMLHVDSTNRITWVERDLAEPGPVTAR